MKPLTSVIAVVKPVAAAQASAPKAAPKPAPAAMRKPAPAVAADDDWQEF